MGGNGRKWAVISVERCPRHGVDGERGSSRANKPVLLQLISQSIRMRTVG